MLCVCGGTRGCRLPRKGPPRLAILFFFILFFLFLN